MNCPMSRLFKAIVLTGTIISGSSMAAERDDLYNQGTLALKEGDCVSAIKFLFAYSVVNEVELNAHPDFKRKLLANITSCEKTLSLAMVTTIGRGGRVTDLDSFKGQGKGKGRAFEGSPVQSFKGVGAGNQTLEKF
jgi:hypothetical protein